MEHVVTSHKCYQQLATRVGEENVFDTLSEMTEEKLRSGLPDPAQHVHVLDYWTGNRSPRADPSLRGVISGLSMSNDEFELAVIFRATLQSLCYGTKHICESLEDAGHPQFSSVFVCGGLCKSKLFLTELADALQIPIVLPREPESMLLGCAILAATADSLRDTDLTSGDGALGAAIVEKSAAMSTAGSVVEPRVERRSYHEKKKRCYYQLYEHFMELRHIMDS